MNFLLYSMILMCSVHIVILDRFTALEVYLMQYRRPDWGHALINFTNSLCDEVWTMRYYPEIFYVYLYCNPMYKIEKIQPIPNHCSGFDCWESQLTLVSRVEIVEIMNRYRNKVAAGSCIKWCTNNTHRLAFELRWNYYLEQNATEVVQTCPQSHMLSRIPIDVAEVGHPLVPGYKEIVVTSFKMETGLQSELRSILWRLMYENYLKDWDEQWQFRRGDMHDVACAFVCRRNVNYVTDTNETVVNGIVGHFACVFLSSLTANKTETFKKDGKLYTFNVSIPINTTLIPSQENCFSIDNDSWAFGAVRNHYPMLCRREQGARLPNILNYDSCDYRPEEQPDICPNSTTYSRITWDEKFYGMILRFNKFYPDNNTTKVDIGQCVVPPPQFSTYEKTGPDILNYFCTLREVVAVQADIDTCSGWNCADSQLTDATRFQVLQMLNQERNRVAKGECSDECPHPCKRCNVNVRYCNMVNLQWHWFLEKKASDRVKNCSTKNSNRADFTFDDDPFSILHNNIVYEEITLLFDLPYYEGQLALPKTFVKLFWMNAFNDWSDFHYFRRANAHFIGCSIVTRSYTIETVEIKPEMNFYNGIPTHMVCIYASISGRFFSNLQESDVNCCPKCTVFSWVLPCWSEFIKNVSPVESLCFPFRVLTSMSCQAGNRCDDDSLSKAWYIQPEGLTWVQTLNGSYIPLKHAGFNAIGIRYERKYCPPVIIIFFLQIPLWIVILYSIYSLQDIKIKLLLKKSITPSFKFQVPEFFSKRKTSQRKSSQKTSEKMSKSEQKQSKKKHLDDVESGRGTPSGSDDVSPGSARGKKPAKETRQDEELGSEDTSDSDESRKGARGKKSPKKTHPEPESGKETATSKGSPNSKGIPKSTRTTKPTKKTLPPEITTIKTTTKEPSTAPVPKKTPIREARSEDVSEEEWEMEAYGGPTVTIGLKLVAPAKIFTGRPRKERKAPKRAKTTPK